MIWGHLYRIVDHMTVHQVAATGGAGTGVSLASAMVDPAAMAPWLHLMTLGVGLVTGIASLVLVTMKIVQQHRNMNGDGET